MISFPVEPMDSNPQPLFQGHALGNLWKFSSGQYEIVDVIESGIGYWVYLDQNLQTTYKIAPAIAQTQALIPLTPGWNIIGVYASIPLPAEAVGTIWRYASGTYHTVQDELIPGVAYWLNFENAGDFDPGTITADTDTDDIPDYWEVLWNFNHTDANDQSDDPDVDKLSNLGEYRAGAHPRLTDTDEDELDDGSEVTLYRSNPLKKDTDKDGFNDGQEVREQTDPANNLSVPPMGITSSPADGERGVALTRETIIRFPKPISKTTDPDANSIFAEFGGEKLAASYHTSPNRRIVTLFYTNSLPASARIRVTVFGDSLPDFDGTPIDVDGNGVTGGTAIFEFDTLTLTILPGLEKKTAVCGRVFASQQDLAVDGATFLDKPLAGVTITVDGAEDTLFTVTDACGNFGDLKSATTPVVMDTPNGNDFPNGKTTTYTYSTGFADERLNSNLLTITDGRRNDPNDPTFGEGPYLINFYAETTNPNDFFFDRVVRQI